MLQFAVCEENMFSMKKITYGLKQILSQLGEGVEIQEYTRGCDLKKAVEGGKFFDAVFMDTEIGGMDGIRLALCLRALQWNNLLIFVSDREQEVFRSFQARPFRFIRKSHFRQEIIPAARDLLKELRKEGGKYLVLKSGGQTWRINPLDIIYAESQRKKQYIYTEHLELEIHDTFKEVMEFLKPHGFIQIHRCYMVNYRYIQSFQGNYMELDNRLLLPVGRQRLTEVRAEFESLCLA